MEKVTTQLTDLIYSAVLGESTWHQFLTVAGRLFEDGKGLLFYHDPATRNGRFLITSGIDAQSAKQYTEYYSSINCWIKEAQARPVGRASHTSSLVPRDELVRTEFYNDFLLPMNVSAGFGLTISQNADCQFMMSILGQDLEDHEVARRFQVVQSLMPHLERAAQFYRRGRTDLGGERELDALSVGLIRVGLGRQITRMNDTAQTIMNMRCALSTDSRGRLTCSEPQVLDELDRILSQWRKAGTQPGARPFILGGCDQHPLMRLTIVPPPADEVLNFFRGPECALLIEPPRVDNTTSVAKLARDGNLTTAEACVVEGLAAGLSIREIAHSRGVSLGTVRTHLKSIFGKTGFRSQVALIRHIGSLAR